jgi:hypothetical protein
MIVTGWHNGSPNLATGAGYGLRVRRRDRDSEFRPGWTAVRLELGGDRTVSVTVSPSFWRRCRELRSEDIGRWMLQNGLAPWPKGCPPRLRLEPSGEALFRLSLM